MDSVNTVEENEVNTNHRIATEIMGWTKYPKSVWNPSGNMCHAVEALIHKANEAKKLWELGNSMDGKFYCQIFSASDYDEDSLNELPYSTGITPEEAICNFLLGLEMFNVDN